MQASRHQMQQFVSHKTIFAAKIEHIKILPDGGLEVRMQSVSGVLQFNADFRKKYAPVIGGFILMHHDGRISYSPGEDFDLHYRAIGDQQNGRMRWCAAQQILEGGGAVSRQGWNGHGQSVRMQRPDAQSKMSAPYLYFENTMGQLLPWLPSQWDLFADDWVVA